MQNETQDNTTTHHESSSITVDAPKVSSQVTSQITSTATIIQEKQQKGKDIILITDSIDNQLLDTILHSINPLVKGNYYTTLFISNSLSSLSIPEIKYSRNYLVTHLDAKRIGHLRHNSHRKRGKSALIVGSSHQAIDHLRRGNLDLTAITHLVIDTLNHQNINALSAHMSFVFQKFNTLPPILILADHNQAELKEILAYLKHPIEIENKNISEVYMNKKEYSHISKDKRNASRIQGVVRKMVSSESPEELDEYRKLIRRNVSIFRRGYLAGYLFKVLTEKDNRANSFSKPRKGHPKNENQRRKNSKPSGTRMPKDSSVRCLYMNVGKIHGLTEDSLRTLVNTTNVLSAEEIESLSIFDRFSFINVPVEKAENLIDALNNVGNYGDKKISVTYSRSR